MTRKEVLDILVNKQGLDENELKGKKLSDLEALLAPEAVQAVKEEEPLAVQKLQLKVNEKRVLGIHPLAERVVIENDRGGDLYVATEMVAFTPENLITPGDSKEFVGAKNLFVGSFSRPLFTVKHFKK